VKQACDLTMVVTFTSIVRIILDASVLMAARHAPKNADSFHLWRPFLHDLDHDMALECAVASGSQCIVTRNVKYFRRVQELKMQAI